MKNLIKSLIWRTKTKATKIFKNFAYPVKKRLDDLEDLFKEGFPLELKDALTYYITEELDSSTLMVQKEAEIRRAEIASHGEKKVPIWYSPKPGSSDEIIKKGEKPVPGEVLEFSMKQIAATGKSKKLASFMHLIIKGFSCKRAVELGSCAGISGIYIASVPTISKFVTVEGSKELSLIAKESLKNKNNSLVVNSLFDNAIEDVLSQDEAFDCAYIDGHHEKLATIHYYNALKPSLTENSIVLFDDISWSYDMREAWINLSKNKDFIHAIDLGEIGLCITRSSQSNNKAPVYWNLQPILGTVDIGKPKGWNKK